MPLTLKGTLETNDFALHGSLLALQHAYLAPTYVSVNSYEHIAQGERPRPHTQGTGRKAQATCTGHKEKGTGHTHRAQAHWSCTHTSPFSFLAVVISIASFWLAAFTSDASEACTDCNRPSAHSFPSSWQPPSLRAVVVASFCTCSCLHTIGYSVHASLNS